MATSIKLGSFFKRGKRDNGDTFVTLKDERPEWLHDAVHAAHFDDLPNDWIYATCEAACDAIDDGRFDGRYWQDNVAEFADGQVDVYTRALYQWAADMCHSSTYSYAESTAEDLGAKDVDTEKRIAMIQYCAIESIANVMIEAWREHKDDDDAEDDEEPSEESEGPSTT